jgi:hypothetical protein
MATLKRHEGYLMIDHRFSPGIPEGAAVKAGFDPRLSGAGKLLESATITCSHCNNIVVLNPNRSRERHYCVKCDKYICDACEALRHTPDYAHRSMAQLSDILLDKAAKGESLGSPRDLIDQPKIFVP